MSKYAYVFLVMKNEKYIAGAVVAALSLKNTGTKYDLVCMVTHDISENGRNKLLTIFDYIVEVDYITKNSLPLKTKKQTDMYKSWIDHSYTKWNALKLIQYKKVIFLDADIILLSSIDSLFELSCPAATFSSPWSYPYVKPGIYNPYLNLKHGDAVPKKAINNGFNNSFVAIATTFLLEPNLQDFDNYNKMLDSREYIGFTKCYSGHDETTIAYYLSNIAKKEFTFIDQSYNFIPWKTNWLSRKMTPKIYHYFNIKPWLLTRSDWPDLEPWWILAKLHVNNNKNIDWSEEFDETELNKDPLQECSYCKNMKLKDFDKHVLISSDGDINCPKINLEA